MFYFGIILACYIYREAFILKKVNIALAQLICEDGKVENNLACLDHVVNIYGHSHDFIIFPETFIRGFLSPEVARTLAEPLNGPIIKHLEHRIGQLDGTTFCGESVVVVDPYGRIIAEAGRE